MKTKRTYLFAILLMLFFLFLSLNSYGQADRTSLSPSYKDSLSSHLSQLIGTQIEREDFNHGHITDPLQLIQSKLPALMITRANNDPNGQFDLRMRGIKSFDVTEPLFVLDGVPVRSLAGVHPSDIASVRVLRGGAESAMWGIRGGNGIIEIQTRLGEGSKPRIRYEGYMAFEGIRRTPDMLDATSFTRNGGFDLEHDTNWWEAITRPAQSQSHHVSLSGGLGTGGTYYASVNYDAIEGIALQSGFDRFNGRLSLKQTALNDKLSIQVGLASTHQEADLVPYSAFSQATSYNPTAPIMGDGPEFDVYGGYFEQVLYQTFNPVSMIQQNTFESGYQHLMMNARATLELTKAVSATVLYSNQSENLENRSFSPSTSFYIGQNWDGWAEKHTTKLNNQFVSTRLDAVKKVGKLTVNASATQHFQDVSRDYFRANGGDFLTDEFGYNNLSAAADFSQGLGTVGTNRTSHQMSSFGGELGLDWEQTYSLTAIFNRSGSSILGNNKKWATFYGLQGQASFGEHLNVRASYGIGGNLPSQSLLSQQIYRPTGTMFFNGNFTQSYGVVQTGNPDLQWEESRELTIGTDVVLANNRIRGSIDYYHSRSGQLIQRQQSYSGTTYINRSVNLGALKSSGIEFAIAMDMTKDRRLDWNLGLLGARYFKTELLAYGLGENAEAFMGNLGGICPFPVFRLQEGGAIGEIWGHVLNPDQPVEVDGSWAYTDTNGDGVITEGDRTVVGNALPTLALGISNQLDWGRFQIDFLFRGVFGHDIVNHIRSFHTARAGIASFNVLNEAITDYGTSTDLPDFFDRDVERASFLRLAYLTLSYDVNPSFLPSLKDLNLYATVQNLFTITGYTGLDPELRLEDRNLRNPFAEQNRLTDSGNPLVPGMDRRNAYPSSRAFVMGINIGL